MKRNKISTLSNIMLSPTFTLFAILISSSHIFFRYGEATNHHHHHHHQHQTSHEGLSGRGARDEDPTSSRGAKLELALNARYQPNSQLQHQPPPQPSMTGSSSADTAPLPRGFLLHRIGVELSQQNHPTQQFTEQASSLNTQTVEPLSLRKTCPPTKPFQCPSDDPEGGECIPILYLCDGYSDCLGNSNFQLSYDEDPQVCAAAKAAKVAVATPSSSNRAPPVERPTTATTSTNFLKTLINVNPRPHTYIEKLLGPRLFKRSGISDQRIAEIQMIRALKKQLERTSNSSA